MMNAIEPMPWPSMEELRAAQVQPKPVLLVPAGCTLTVPAGFDFSPYSRVEVAEGARLLHEAPPKPAKPAHPELPTARGLTFEQPIQSRLGRMAK